MGNKPVKSVANCGRPARAGKQSKTLGRLHGQKFFVARANAMGEVAWPFGPRPFSAMVEIRREAGEDALARLAEGLFSHGCRGAVCRGAASDRCRDVFDRVADDSKFFRPGGYSPWSMVYEEEFEEALAYFTLPTGQTDTGLLVVVGDEADFRQAAGGFGRFVGRAAEWLAEVEPEDAKKGRVPEYA